jgi:hypothetical protein
MKYILLIIGYNILSIFSAYEIKPKLCIDCKFFRKGFFTNNKYGKCSLFPIEEENNNRYLLVDGNKMNNKPEYHYCAVARKFKSMCGPEGTLYVKKSI